MGLVEIVRKHPPQLAATLRVAGKPPNIPRLPITGQGSVMLVGPFGEAICLRLFPLQVQWTTRKFRPSGLLAYDSSNILGC